MTDGKTIARSASNAILPFLTGFVLGALSTIAAFAGRIATLETTATVHSEALRDIRTEIHSVSEKLDQCILVACRKGGS